MWINITLAVGFIATIGALQTALMYGLHDWDDPKPILLLMQVFTIIGTAAGMILFFKCLL